MADEALGRNEEQGSSPASRGGAGTYIEGELGAFYLLTMLADIPAHGLPLARILQVRFQGTDLGYKLDDLILHGVNPAGDVLLEIQSKRDITFAPRDAVYRDVARQIARSQPIAVAEDRHFLGIATQRTSRKVSGAYQDVLKWAAAAENGAQFFKRLEAKGVANPDMRSFVATSRTNFVAAGVLDDNEAIWRILRRLLILEFDFESSAPLARTHALMLARQVLADEVVGQADGLWRVLTEIAIGVGTTGGVLDRDELKRKLVEAGFRLAGDRDYGPARIKLADMGQMTLAGIGNTVAGVNLPRLSAVADLDEALETRRYIEVRGGPGVGKSWLLRNAAERFARQSAVIVLDPVGTPAGGWIAFAQALGIPGTATGFLTDLAASGGSIIFIDGLEMFVDPTRQRTVSDLLRAASKIPGFTVIATTRTSATADADSWLDDQIVAAFGGGYSVPVGNLTDDEVATLVEQAPELRVLLDSRHPAAGLARNLYRLSRLLKLRSATEVRTEAALADLWWTSADSAESTEVRAAQRILADVAARALKGEIGIELRNDSAARSHLLKALTLREVHRDQLDFYHDVLRDWAIGSYIAEDPSRLDGLDLSKPVSPRIARGIEFAGRLALETGADYSAWVDLLAHLSPTGAHGSWRRQAMFALTRSEAWFELLDKCSGALLGDGGALLVELCTAIAAVETAATADLMRMPDGSKVDLPRSFRTNTTGSAILLLRWVLNQTAEIPLQAIGAVVNLIDIQIHALKRIPSLAQPAAAMLFNWLRQLDVRDAKMTMPGGGGLGWVNSDGHRRVIERLRFVALLLAEFEPDALKAYLNEIAAERGSYKLKEIRPLSPVIAPVAPAELSELVLASLVDKRDRRRRHDSSMDRAFTFTDSDYLPASPAQPPFLDLLDAAPAEGLKLIRTLVTEALAHHTDGNETNDDGFTLVFDDGPRFFPWPQSYFWSRDQAREYSVASGLKALEAWGQRRLDDGEAVDLVLADILGPNGSCAAFLLVAVDLLLSHLDKARDALLPFLACPELLSIDTMRFNRDRLDLDRAELSLSKEPAGKVTLADLGERISRQISLHSVLSNYLGDDLVANRLRDRLRAAVERLDPYDQHSSWDEPRFIGRFALNALERSNWKETRDGKLAYQSPADEAAHLEQMRERYAPSLESSETRARIELAMEGGKYATAETARVAVDHADGDLPDDSDTDVLRTRSTRLIATALLVARDGDDCLLDAHETWVRQVIDLGLTEQSEGFGGSRDTLRFNRPAIATLALIHLWARKGSKADRDKLVSLATRRDQGVAPAFSTALVRILELEPKLFKAAMRAAFASCIWRWHSYWEDEAEQQAFDAERTAEVEAAVGAEIAWLDGGTEPDWPDWPEEYPSLRHGLRIRLPATGKTEDSDADETEEAGATKATSIVRADSQAAAQWLGMVRSAPNGSIGWEQEVVEAYSEWTDRMNGLGLPGETEIERDTAEWNLSYFVLFAERLLDAPQALFEKDLRRLTGLPDDSFCAVAQTVIHAADALYFDHAQRSAARLVDLRLRLGERVVQLRRWKFADEPGSSRIDRDSADVVATMLLNTYNLFNGTRSFVPPALFDDVDPLLATMRPLLPGGPTSFVALCTMNMLMVAPRARHLDFILFAVEAWFKRTGAAGLWIDLGIGSQIVRWFDAAIAEKPEIIAPGHPERDRIDHMLSCLVSVGVAEAHELEKQVEAAASSPK